MFITECLHLQRDGLSSQWNVLGDVHNNYHINSYLMFAHI